MYDTLRLVNDLEALGVPRPQAEGYVKTVQRMVDSNFATKADFYALSGDLKEAEHRLRAETVALGSELRKEMSSINERVIRVEESLTKLELRLTIKLGTIVSIGIGVAVTLTKLLT